MAHHSIRTSKSGTSLLFLAALAVVLAASPAFAVSLDLTSATVSQSGELAQICVNLSTEGQLVAGTQNDLIWDETCATLSSKGNCTVTPGLGKQLQSNMPSGDGHPPLRAFVLSLSDVSPIGDTQLYCCTFRSELTQPGTCCNISLSRLGASTPDGKALRTTTTTGAGSPILCLRGNGGASGGGSSAGSFGGGSGGAIGGVNTGGFDSATSNNGTGNAGTGNAGTGNAATGNTGTGNTDTGNTGTGNAATGNTDTGNAGTGNTGTGNTGAESAGASTTGAGSTTGGQGSTAPQAQAATGSGEEGAARGGGRRRTAWTGRARQSSRAARGGPRAAGAAAAAVATARRGAG